ncbi:MAG: acyl-CoA mutase large subunit family protein [Oligoflexales bacterium]|nr:acyl-CoA mutase large subunit family protein [Oligoflexales bacterium]
MAKIAVERGADSIGFISHFQGREIAGVLIKNQKDFSKLFEDIDLAKVPVHLDFGHHGYTALAMFLNEIEERDCVPGQDARGSFSLDPSGDILRYGISGYTYPEHMSIAAEHFRAGSEYLPSYRLFTFQGHHYHNAGCSAVEELAFTMASAVETIFQLNERGLSTADILQKSGFSFSTGSNYFMEIAKLRAARLVWSSIVSQMGIKDDDTARMNIHSKSSSWNKCSYDCNTNILRLTTEGMSAVLGGADSLSLMPHDDTLKAPTEFSYRIARNIQLILKHEACLDKVADPSAGSYFIENLTDEIASRVTGLFKEIEGRGGFYEAIKKGFIQNKIEETSKTRSNNIARRKDVFLGVSQYPDLTEKILGEITLEKAVPISAAQDMMPLTKTSFSFLRDLLKRGERLSRFTGRKPSQETDGITPLHAFRGAGAFERIRLATERYAEKCGENVKVFLWTFGNPAMRRARASFCLNFFGSAGFEIIDHNGYETIGDGLKALAETRPLIVVLCSSDDEYGEQGISILNAIEDYRVFKIVAGNPKHIAEKLKDAGIDDFVHIKTEVTEFLADYQKKLGIET